MKNYFDNQMRWFSTSNEFLFNSMQEMSGYWAHDLKKIQLRNNAFLAIGDLWATLFRVVMAAGEAPIDTHEGSLALVALQKFDNSIKEIYADFDPETDYSQMGSWQGMAESLIKNSFNWSFGAVLPKTLSSVAEKMEWFWDKFFELKAPEGSVNSQNSDTSLLNRIKDKIENTPSGTPEGQTEDELVELFQLHLHGALNTQDLEGILKKFKKDVLQSLKSKS